MRKTFDPFPLTTHQSEIQQQNLQMFPIKAVTQDHVRLEVHRRLNYVQALGASYCFEAGMSVKLCEDVPDVIIHSGRTDVELLGTTRSIVIGAMKNLMARNAHCLCFV
jgi:hypothetical protein